MKITEQIVKTFYTVEFSAQDLKAAVDAYHASETQQIVAPKAYENMDPKAMEDPDTLACIYKHMGGFGHYGSHGDTFKALAHFFGFDGWENAGIYNEHTGTRYFVAYNRGDHLNQEANR